MTERFKIVRDDGLEIDEETGEILALPEGAHAEYAMAHAMKDAASQEAAWKQTRQAISRWFVQRFREGEKRSYGDLYVGRRVTTTTRWDLDGLRQWVLEDDDLTRDELRWLVAHATGFKLEDAPEDIHPARMLATFRSFNQSHWAQAVVNKRPGPRRVAYEAEDDD